MTRRHHSEETKRKISEATKGRAPWNKGKRGYFTYQHTAEAKDKIRQSQLPDCGAIFPTPQSLGGHVTSVHTPANLELIIAQKEKLKKNVAKRT